MREREGKKSFSVMDFDLIFQITPSPSQKADQMSHHGDIIKKKQTNKQTNKQNKKKLIKFHTHMPDERRTAEIKTSSVVPKKTLNAN